MSHFTKLAKANIVNINAAKRAAEEMGIEVEENGLCRGWVGQTMCADLVLKMDGKYDVAIKKNGTTYEIIAESMMRPENINSTLNPEFQGIRSVKQFADLYLQQTTKHTIIEEMQMQGFYAENFQVDANKDMTFDLVKY